MEETPKDELTEKVRFIQKEGSLEQEELLVVFIQQLYKEVREKGRSQISRDDNVIFFPAEFEDLDNPELWSRKNRDQNILQPRTERNPENDLSPEPPSSEVKSGNHNKEPGEEIKNKPDISGKKRIAAISLSLCGLAFLAFSMFFFYYRSDSPDPPSRVCDIKGNINIHGEKIYHLPGGEWYFKTQVERRLGERWFCSEAEAREMGWRKSSK